jgi:hypothetical protein
MAWDSQYALDGFFQFGGPLNVTRYVIDPEDNKFGQSTDTYWVARFLLDEEIAVIARLNALMRGPIVYYPVVYLLRRLSASADSKWVTEQRFYKSWLFSLGGNFSDPRNPAVSTAGQTLGIALNKADNRHIIVRS